MVKGLDLMTLHTVHPMFKNHCFHWTLDESMGTISLNQFVNLFLSYTHEAERNFCFHQKFLAGFASTSKTQLASLWTPLYRWY